MLSAGRRSSFSGPCVTTRLPVFLDIIEKCSFSITFFHDKPKWDLLNRSLFVLLLTNHSNCYLCFTCQNTACRVSINKTLRREAEELRLAFGRTRYDEYRKEILQSCSGSSVCRKRLL